MASLGGINTDRADAVPGFTCTLRLVVKAPAETLMLWKEGKDALLILKSVNTDIPSNEDKVKVPDSPSGAGRLNEMVLDLALTT
jgi:hypothetical protein